MNAYVFLLILLIIYIITLSKRVKFTQITSPIKIYIFTKKDCPACIYYKKYTHDYLTKKLNQL